MTSKFFTNIINNSPQLNFRFQEVFNLFSNVSLTDFGSLFYSNKKEGEEVTRKDLINLLVEKYGQSRGHLEGQLKRELQSLLMEIEDEIKPPSSPGQE